MAKDEATNFIADIANTNNLKNLLNKRKTDLGNRFAQGAPNQANVILENARIAVPLKYLSNFWRSLEMSLINCKVDLKLQWTKYCVLSVAGADNTNTNLNHIIFPIKNTKFYVRVVNLSARDYQKLLKLLSKGFERSVYWNEYKTKSKNKNTINE